MEIIESGVLPPAWEKIDRALAKGDAAALRPLVADKVYDVAISDWKLHQYDPDELIPRQIAERRECELAGSHERPFEIGRVFGSVVLKNAMFAQMGEQDGHGGADREKVLPEDGLWLFLGRAPDINHALERCGVGRGARADRWHVEDRRDQPDLARQGCRGGGDRRTPQGPEPVGSEPRAAATRERPTADRRGSWRPGRGSR